MEQGQKGPQGQEGVLCLAAAATVTGVLSGWSVVPTLLVVTVGSVVLGLVLAPVSLALNARVPVRAV